MYVVEIDERGRITIPKRLRERFGLRGRVAIRARDGAIELIPLERIRGEISRSFEEKFKDWREEDHEASREIFRLTGKEESD